MSAWSQGAKLLPPQLVSVVFRYQFHRAATGEPQGAKQAVRAVSGVALVEVGMNFYTVLGVPRDADEETIRGAYRILARRYHPDRGAGSSAENFRRVNEAYQSLTDPGSRRSHDLSLQRAERQVPVRVEPIMTKSGSFPLEDVGVFGRFAGAPQGDPFRASASFDESFDRWFYSLGDMLFNSEWPW